MTITLEERLPSLVGSTRKRTTLPTGVVINKDSNGNIIRVVSPYRNTSPFHYTIPQVFSLASRIEKHRNKYN